MKAPSIRKTKRLVLAGAGHAHLAVLKKFAMKPLDDLEVVLINPSNEAYYSGMIPGMLARRFQREELCFDVNSLCSSAIFIKDEIVSLHVDSKEVILRERPAVTFDFISFNVGSKSGASFPLAMNSIRCISTRPLQALWKKIEAWDLLVRPRDRIGVVGAGAAGVEICLALQVRYPNAAVFLIGTPSTAEARLLRTFSVEVVLDRAEDIHVKNDKFFIRFRDESRMEREADFLFLATGAAPHDFFVKAGLKIRNGALLVNDSLHSLDHNWLFGAGDCISLDNFSWVEKSGVYSVREGAILAENLNRAVLHQELLKYKPQREFLRLLSDARGGALARWYGFTIHNSLMGKWKDQIDLAFMEKFKTKAKPSEEPECGGCGSKVSADVLCALTSRPEEFKHASVEWGKAEKEDIALLHFGRFPGSSTGGTSLGITVDQFKNVGVDPFVFGKIAAIHSASDLYAKNIAPQFALMNLQIPKLSSALAKNWMQHLGAGVESIFAPEKVQLLGGQTLEGEDWSLGFTMLGEAGEKLYRKNSQQEGNCLWLTKPLGTGILLAAAMAGEHLGDAWSEVLEGMCASLEHDWSRLQNFKLESCTDVTGFSFLGHLAEMLRDTGLGADLQEKNIPFYPMARELYTKGYHSRMQELNRRSFPVELITDAQLCLYDPQTCGGFLLSVSETVSRSIEHFVIEKNIQWRKVGVVSRTPGIRLN